MDNLPAINLMPIEHSNWGRVTHICVSKLTIIGSENALSPCRCQGIIWTNAAILLIRPFRTNFSEILIETHTFSFNKMYLKTSSGKWRPFYLGLNVLTNRRVESYIHAIHEMQVCQNLSVTVPTEELCQFPFGFICESHHCSQNG